MKQKILKQAGKGEKKKSFHHPCHLKSGEPCYNNDNNNNNNNNNNSNNNNNNNNNNIWAQLELTDALVSGHCIETQASLSCCGTPACTSNAANNLGKAPKRQAKTARKKSGRDIGQ